MTTDLTNAAEQSHTPQTLNLEASLAPREGDLFSLPFDQYGRMKVAQRLLDYLYVEAAEQDLFPAGYRMSVLDVGGYPGILRHFASEGRFDVAVVDVVPDDGSIPGYRQGSGLSLPFPDESFDIVTSLDTLEHIPNGDRPLFLGELRRVARYGIVLINPVQSLDADLAEETLDEYIRWLLDAQQEQLAEHRAFGLPDAQLTGATLRSEGWETLEFPLANVNNWLFMMVAKHYLISLRDERASGFERSLDRFYNLAYGDGDRALPAYRGVLVATRPQLVGALRRIGEAYPPVETSEGANGIRLQLTQLLLSLLNLKTGNHEDRLLREQIEARDRHIAGMETRIAIQEMTLDRLNVEIERLNEAVVGKEGHIRNLESMFTALQESTEVEFRNHEQYITRLEEEQRNKDEHILYLEKLLQGIQQGRVMRVTRAVARFLGRR